MVRSDMSTGTMSHVSRGSNVANGNLLNLHGVASHAAAKCWEHSYVQASDVCPQCTKTEDLYFELNQGLITDELHTSKASTSHGSDDDPFLEEDVNVLHRNWEHELEQNEALRNCLQFCYFFSKDSEFDQDDMVQLWMAEGCIPPEGALQTPIEHTASLCFKHLLSRSIFQFTRFDNSSGRPRYNMNHFILDKIQEQLPGHKLCRIEECKHAYLSENTLHASLLCNYVEPTSAKDLYHRRLSIVMLLRGDGSQIHHIPRDLLREFPSLKCLDLSNTNITELPNSIGNMRDLRYLNLSMTPITSLPDSLCNLEKMQTLKLRDCLELLILPNNMSNLSELRHLDIDVACLLITMPPELGKLCKLQTLPAFVLSKYERGCSIIELKNMVNLQGTLRILRLENLSKPEEAMDATLHEKNYLDKLELQWTEEIEDGAKVLENLQPHKNLHELQIVGYGGASFPNWIGDPVFSNLTTITLHDCSNCELLPPLGKLPLLKFLCLSNMHAVKTIDRQFSGKEKIPGLRGLGMLLMKSAVRRLTDDDMWKEYILPTVQNLTFNAITNLESWTAIDESDDEITGVSDFGRRLQESLVGRVKHDGSMFKAFPSLERLTLDGMTNLEKWTEIEEGDFPSLHTLNISGCPKLIDLPELSLLKSLQQLEISLCPSLESFSNNGLPPSLKYLVIIYCPLLKEWCHEEKEEDDGMLAHIPNIWIDYQQISE